MSRIDQPGWVPLATETVDGQPQWLRVTDTTFELCSGEGGDAWYWKIGVGRTLTASDIEHLNQTMLALALAGSPPPLAQSGHIPVGERYAPPAQEFIAQAKLTPAPEAPAEVVLPFADLDQEPVSVVAIHVDPPEEPVSVVPIHIEPREPWESEPGEYDDERR